MEKETERKCIVTGLIKPQNELLRFVTEDGQLIPDFNKKFAGKGIYVSVSRQALQKALLKNLFAKAARGHVKIQDNLPEMVEHLIEASDAGADGSSKMAALAKNLEVLRLYDIAELDAALDKVNTVHVAVLKGSMSNMVYNNLKKYQAFLD